MGQETATIDELTELAIEAKHKRAAYNELLIHTLAFLRRAAEKAAYEHADDILQEFAANFRRYIDVYDHDRGQVWKSFAYSRFNWFVIDYFRRPESQPVCNYRSRNGSTVVEGFSLHSKINLHADDRPATVMDTLGDTSQQDQRDALENFEELIGCLTFRFRSVMRLRYLQGLTMKEVADIHGISESRISQMHSQACAAIKTALAAA